MVDIDLFKQVNDTHGHDVGDRVICRVADLIQGRMRATDIVARVGGEEFCVLAVNMESHDAQLVFDELRQEIADDAIAYGSDGESLHVSVSIGVCTETSGSLEEMMKKADALLYKAKDSGRNCVKLK